LQVAVVAVAHTHFQVLTHPVVEAQAGCFKAYCQYPLDRLIQSR
jgi:hypothetical protein